MTKWSVAYGSTIGSMHRKLNYNNQDAVMVSQGDWGTIGIVADGCGSGSNSEVGAQLGVYYLTNQIQSYLEKGEAWQSKIEADFKAYTKALVALHGQDAKTFVKDFGLFTLIGVVSTPEITTLFYAGDGVVIVDENIQIINQNNRPKYINNDWLGEEGGRLEFMPLDNPKKIVLGTDGCEDLLEAIEKQELSEYKDWKAFRDDAELWSSPIKLPKLLMQASEASRLRDDTSIILLKHEEDN